jgi:hypothetical protein
MSNGFIYVVDAHFIDKIEENKYPGPKCLCMSPSRSGVRGYMWNWINAFLNHREVRCIVNDHTGVWFQTSIGLPQGSVISPILMSPSLHTLSLSYAFSKSINMAAVDFDMLKPLKMS